MAEFQLPAHIRFVRSLSRRPGYSLSDSCCQTLRLAELLQLAGTGQVADLPLHYASLQGDPELREAIAGWHGGTVAGNAEITRPDQVTVFCGAQEALFAIFNAVLTRGDEVIIFTPCYPSLATMAGRIGARTVAVPMDHDSAWSFPLDRVREAVSEHTRLIVVNSPHNPTGAVLDPAQAFELVKLADERGIHLLSDDVSAGSDFNAIGLTHPFLQYERTVAVGVLSKSFGLGGIRIGWSLCIDPQLREKLEAVKASTSICPSAIDEQIARLALQSATPILQRNNSILRENISRFREFTRAAPVQIEWDEPRAGILSLARLDVDRPVETLARDLTARQDVMILPGSLFLIDGNWFRLGLGQRSFTAALQRFDRYLHTLK